MIYLDNAATTMIAPRVLDAMMPYLKEEYGNAGTIYGLGRRAADAISKARRQVADFIGAKPEQIIFTSGGTEANNLAILGCKDYLESIGKKHIITTPTEHDSVLRAINALCKQLRHNDSECIKPEFYTSFLSVDKYGHASVDSLIQKLNNYDDVGLISVMYTNNEVGVLNNIKHIGQLRREKCILFHTDCVQAAGNVPLNVDEIGCDFMSISSHKIHGPKGIGALYVRDKKYLSPIINGGLTQEFGLRGGTENVASIVGFGEACELASKGLDDYSNTIIYYKKLFYKILQDRLAENNLDNDMSINGLLPRYPGKTLSITFKNVDAETLVLMMDSKGVCISAGSACTSHESKPSHVLKAIGLSEDDARSTVRISFSEFNTTYEIERAAKILANCVNTLRGVEV